MNNIIDEIRDFMVEFYSSNYEWAEATALSLLSTLIGKSRYIRTNIAGNTYLNMMFVGLAPSRYGNKSVSLKFVRHILAALDEAYLQLPSIKQSSIEGLIELFSEQPYGLLFEDEVAASFIEKQYKFGMGEFLSQLYDGYIDGRYTKKDKLVEGREVYVNFIGAGSLIFFRNVSDELFTQGLGNRILWMRWGDVARTYDVVNNDVFTKGMDYLRKRLNPISDPSANSSEGAELKFTSNAINLIISQSKKYDADAMKISEYDNKRGVYAEAALHIRKLSALRAIGDGKGEVDIEHVKWAITKMSYFIKQFSNVVDEWNEIKGSQPHKNEKTQLDTIMNVAHSLSGEYDNFKFGDWSDLVKLGYTKFNDFVSALVESGKVIELSDEQKQSIPRKERNGWKAVNARVFSTNVVKYNGDGQRVLAIHPSNIDEANDIVDEMLGD